MVYSLLSMLGTHDPEDMSQTLLAMSSSADSCVAMRQSGCLPLLVQVTVTRHCLSVPSDLLYSSCYIFWEVFKCFGNFALQQLSFIILDW